MKTPEAKPTPFDEAYTNFAKGTRQNPFGFSADDIILSLYRLWVREKLKELFGGKFWVGPDIATANSARLEPNCRTLVPIAIPSDLKPFTDLHPYAFSCVYASTRSRYAQLGLEVSKATGVEIAATLQPVQDSHDSYKALIPVINQGVRAIHLSCGEKFFYLYWWGGATVTGQKLVDLVGSKIKIEGEQGKDWQWWHNSAGEIGGVEFLIDPQSRAWIPPHTEPARISDGQTVNHSRDIVDAYLKKPVPQTGKPLFWVGETRAEITLDPSVHGLVDMSVACSMGACISEEENFDFQANSVLIQGGNTAGRLRTEICSPTTEDKIPQAILLRFAMAR